MKLKPIIFYSIACIIFIGGLAVYYTGSSYSVYTDPEAPVKLSQELGDLPREERFSKWYQQLADYETPYKKYTDLGRGLISISIGIILGTMFFQLLPKANNEHIARWIWGYWTFLWIIKFPLSMWYYNLRQTRFDYPSWGDSIFIGIYNDFISWVIWYIFFSVVLFVLMVKYKFSSKIQFTLPKGIWEWSRMVFLYLWLLLLFTCIIPSISGGDEGMAISCTGAISIVLLAISALKQKA